MQVTLLKSKLHRATVTDGDKNYGGSIAIDADLMKTVGLINYERVDVYNITNGERFTTYAIPATGGSGHIVIQGAAVHKADTGDMIIICSYAQMSQDEAKDFKPQIVVLDENNKVKS